jgi:hypothetical protein
LVTVALVMAAMMVTMAIPAFANHGGAGKSYGQCQKEAHPAEGDIILLCLKPKHPK